MPDTPDAAKPTQQRDLYGPDADEGKGFAAERIADRHVDRIPKFSLMMGWWSLVSAMFYVYIGALVASFVGVFNAVIGPNLHLLHSTASKNLAYTIRLPSTFVAHPEV